MGDINWKCQKTMKCTVKAVLAATQKEYQNWLSLNAGQKYCRMLQGVHSAILLTFIKVPFIINILVLSNFEWPLKTGFTVYIFCSLCLLDQQAKGIDSMEIICNFLSDSRHGGLGEIESSQHHVID